jgi:uroporphyrinogen decarboxylase
LALAFGWDFIPVFLVPSKNRALSPPTFLDKYTWVEPDGRIMKFSPVTEGHAVCIKHPPLDSIDLDNEPPQIDDSELEFVNHVVKEYGETHFILGRGGDGTFPHERYGLIELLVGIIDDPQLVKQIIHFETTKAIAINEALLDAGCDGVIPGDDYCSKDGPMMSPKHFDEFIQPALASLCESAHRKGKYLIKHTDGHTWPIMDSMIEAGIDGWHGIQSLVGMDLSKLKASYGEQICFWGGVDVDYLISGTPELIRKIVMRSIEAAAPHGGFVLTSGNTLMVGVSLDNYGALINAHREFGTYQT